MGNPNKMTWIRLNTRSSGDIMFFVSSSFFPLGQKKKSMFFLQKNTSKTSCHSTSVRSKQIPPSKTKLQPTKTWPKSSPSGWTQCWWQEVSLMWFCPWPVEETMEWPYASFQPCVSVSLVLFLGPNFSARENTGKSNDLDFVCLFGGEYDKNTVL